MTRMPNYERCPDCGEIHKADSTEEAVDIAQKHLGATHGAGVEHDAATKVMDSIIEMKEFGILEMTEQREDGEPIVTEDLVGNFIKELNYDNSFELQWRLLRQEDISAAYRMEMMKSMVKAILHMTGSLPKERLEGFLRILSTLVPFNTILFSVEEQ